VPLPTGSTYRQVANRLTSAVRNMDVKAPDGCFFSKRQTTDGKLSISVLAVAPKKSRKKAA
jgi:hypothetical protein